jgi:isopentenyl diphosphate isomerase/L-lactate dehydrogenase-like FMN-dependent dehydrogenase
MIRKAEQIGVKVLCVTVDAPMLGRREKDMRYKAIMDPNMSSIDKVYILNCKFTLFQNIQFIWLILISFPKLLHSQRSGTKDKGIAMSLSRFIDPSLNWKDIDWMRSVTDLPIVLKVCLWFWRVQSSIYSEI